MDPMLGPNWLVRAVRALRDAILCTLVYADLFDYPLTAQEVHRYLIGYSVGLDDVRQYLDGDGLLGGELGSEPPFYFLAGRDRLVDIRRQRRDFSEALWRRALRYGSLAASVPFVRMVSITGSLAMDNAYDLRDDIDLLIVTAPERVWLARGMVVLLVRLARGVGLELCPNYVMAEDHLELPDRTLFTAHELAQLVPLNGLDVYKRLWQCNGWLNTYLPNASPRQACTVRLGAALRAGQRVLETALSGTPGDSLDRWEAGRKIPRLQRIALERGGRATSYTPCLCKGHVDDHAGVMYRLFMASLAGRGLEPS